MISRTVWGPVERKDSVTSSCIFFCFSRSPFFFSSFSLYSFHPLYLSLHQSFIPSLFLFLLPFSLYSSPLTPFILAFPSLSLSLVCPNNAYLLISFPRSSSRSPFVSPSVPLAPHPYLSSARQAAATAAGGNVSKKKKEMLCVGIGSRNIRDFYSGLLLAVLRGRDNEATPGAAPCRKGKGEWWWR